MMRTFHLDMMRTLHLDMMLNYLSELSEVFVLRNKVMEEHV